VFTPKKRTDRSPAASGSIGDGLANGFEYAGAVLLFTLLGWLLDKWLHTKPLFIVGLTVVGIIGQFARTFYGYSAEMRRHEEKRLANGRPANMTAETEHPPTDRELSNREAGR
jgi:F0F1-type ATP synthase assembly protein I